METKNLILLAGMSVLCMFALCKLFMDRDKSLLTAKNREIPDRVYYIILILIAAVALFVRLYQFGVVPGGSNQDGAMAAVEAAALAEYGTDRFGMRFPVFFTGWITAQMAVMLSYLAIPFVKLFGLSILAVRLPQLLISLLGLLFLYLLTRDVFGRNIALVISGFAAIAPWHIMQSRWALESNMYPHFFIAGVYFLNLAVREGIKRKYLIISMVIFGLSMYCYGVSIYTMPVFLLMACIYLLVKNKVTFSDAAIAFVTYLLFAWPFIVCMAINFFQFDTIETPLFTIPYFSESVRASDILFFADNFLEQLRSNLRSLFNMTVAQTMDSLWNNVEKYGTTYRFSISFAVVGIAVLFQYFRKKAGSILIFFFLLTGIWCGIVTNNVNINRVNIIYYPIIILIGIGIYYTGFAVYSILIRSGILAVYAVVFVTFVYTYFTTYADQIAETFYKNFTEALAAVRDSDADVYYITADTQYEGSYMVSEILTMLWLDIDAEYFQGKTADENGLYYSEKYIYVRMEDLEIDPDQDAVYIITYGDAQYFDEEDFDLIQYGSYFVATPK
ncbi:MAG: glycosyltransferase family 39 protein [Lachnospiraceae bacterium]|nr:glycosyltransferase family 39 protein [Lachnospiraceae bacterium]